MPRVKRPPPPFVQISDYFRDQIQKGTLRPGDRMPPIAEIARDWNVATATAAKAVTRLQAEGDVRTSARGTFVGADERISESDGSRRANRACAAWVTALRALITRDLAAGTDPRVTLERVGQELEDLSAILTAHAAPTP